MVCAQINTGAAPKKLEDYAGDEEIVVDGCVVIEVASWVSAVGIIGH